MTLGRLFYLCYHVPLGAIRRSLREGGPLVQWKTERNRREMIHATDFLPTVPTTDAVQTPYQIHLLTGRKYWYQTAFCVGSLLGHATRETDRPLQPVFYDDGTLQGPPRERLQALFPLARFVSLAETRERLEQHLPARRFPALRDRWEKYPHIRKLTDPHLGSTGWKLVLDSDLLFFRSPDFLLRWLDRPMQPCHMVDIADAYGYPRALLEEVAGTSLPMRLNVGLCGLRGEEIDWERLERWTSILHDRAGTSYYLEQALVAMIAAGRPCAVAPAEEYVTLPGGEEAQAPAAVMHHYVAGSKSFYFQHCWRVCLDRWTQANDTPISLG